MSDPPAARAEPIDRLRDDVHLLGSLVGEVLREQGGDQLFDAVERIRTGAIAMRSGAARDGDRAEQLAAWMNEQPTERLLQIVRAFGVYFHLINLAEQHHRLRTLGERARGDLPVAESLDAAMVHLRHEGVSDAQLREALRRLSVHPVFTAHPSETRRRTLLHHLEEAAHLIDQLDQATGPSHRRDALDRLRARITLIWQTAEVRLERPSVLDEVQSVLYILAGPVIPAVLRVQSKIDDWLMELGSTPASEVPPAIRLGSWVGGDRDGNPSVTPEITRAAARLSRAAALRRHLESVQALGRDLSISQRLTGASRALMQSVERDRRMLGVQAVAEWADEPYRRKTGLIAERLRRTEAGAAGAYASPTQLVRDLELISASLQAHRGGRVAMGEVARFRREVETFGFHVAELEVRQHADVHRQSVDEMLALSGVAGFSGLAEPDRQAALERQLVGSPTSPADAALSPATRQVLDTLRAISDIQTLSGPRACHTYVISMCRYPSDILGLLYLAREAGLFQWQGRGTAICLVDVVPLFETVEELQSAGLIMSRTLGSRAYRAALRARGWQQQVMVGYSDSNKYGGYLAASWHTYRAQRAIASELRRDGIGVTIFHGRGGAVGRGGGPTTQAILAQPPEIAERLGFKVTEQGEVVATRYAHPALAERHIEQLTHALLVSALEPEQPGLPGAWTATMERLAGVSCARYEALVKHTDGFLDFFTEMTPFPELASLNLASRPVSRSSRAVGAIGFDDLRAIPWVFSWTQARVNMPGWYGLGTALEDQIKAGGLEQLRDMYREWRFFSSTIDNAQLSLSTADMPTARRYATLARRPELFDLIEDEFERSVRSVLAVTGQRTLLEERSLLARSIRLRNPYVDALHLAQLTLLRRHHELPLDGDEDERARLLDAIHHSINGIAAGLQTTG